MNKEISNPFSTGSGGATFEQLVGAAYLVTLMAGHMPRGLDWGVTKEVLFQQRWSGCLIDDLIIVATDGNTERRLALQLKHDLRFATSDQAFVQVIGDCWSVFVGNSGWHFNPDIDRIGIGLGLFRTELDAHFRPLLEWARNSRNAVEFIQKVDTPKFSSAEKREYLGLFRELLTQAKGSRVGDDELWMFLKCFVIVHYDLENAGSRDSTHCWNALNDLLSTSSSGQAQILFDQLCSIVARNNRTAGYIDIGKVRSELSLSIALKDHAQYETDLKRLRDYSQKRLASISNTIGLHVQLPRTSIINQLEESIKQKEIVVITGLPMVGKSGALKLLANRLQLEGEVFVFTADDFSNSTSFIDFLHQIGISNDLQNILSAVGNSTVRCIFVDGLERLRDDGGKRVLNDLLVAVRQYNEALIKRGGHPDYRWHVVFTCRQQESMNVLVHLETRHNLEDKSLDFVTVSALTDDEVTEVAAQVPRLKELVTRGHLKEILSRPLVLDILTLPEVALPPESIPSHLTETWLIDWFWKEVVRLAEKMRPGRGSPEQREKVLNRLALEALEGSETSSTMTDQDAAAVAGLVSDRLVLRQDALLRFGHDALEDWTLAKILHQRASTVELFLAQMSEPLRVSRAFQLFAARFLEVEKEPQAWLRLLQRIEQDTSLSPRWYQLAVTALLDSSLLKEILPTLHDDLFGNDNYLLCKILWTLRTLVVQSHPSVYGLGALPRDEFEKYLAYWNMPIWTQWIPVVEFVLKNRQLISERGLYEFSFVAEKWMSNSNGKQLFRREIAELAMEQLASRFLIAPPMNEREESSLSYEEVGQIRKNFVNCVLLASDCLPDDVSQFVRQYALRSRDSNHYDFEEEILRKGYGWIPLCKHLPDLAVEIIEGILCEKAESDPFGGLHHIFHNLGISYMQRDMPPVPHKGPFKTFLQVHPEQGLELVQRVVNHATKIWILREEHESNRKPLPQILKLETGNVEVWGDALVYQWFRFPSVAPGIVTCALMALEEWMNDQIGKDANANELFEKILYRTNSVAVVGVCVSVALANVEKCVEAIAPIIENPAFWEMDIARFAGDLAAESSAKSFSTYLSLGDDKKDYERLIEMARQTNRKLDIRSFIVPIIFNASKDVRERVLTAIKAFPENPPSFFEGDADGERQKQSREKTYRVWAAYADRENYKFSRSDDASQLLIQFRLPEDLEAEQRGDRAFLESQNKLYSFQNWCIGFLQGGHQLPAFNLESAMTYAQELVALDNPLHKPTHFLEDSEARANAIAMFVAALVIHAWDWIQQSDYVSWARDQLLIAASRPEPQSDSVDAVGRFEMGYRRSAARALPVLRSKDTKDSDIRKSILSLAVHPNEEVRAFVFSSLCSLWGIDDAFVWECIRGVERQARARAVRDQYWILDGRPNVIVTWGRFAGIKQLNKRVSRFVRLLLLRFRPKPVRESTGKDISDRLFQSVLYVLPVDARINQWVSDRHLKFLFELLAFTVNNYLHFQKEDKSYNEWSHSTWNQLFFPVLVNAILRLPSDGADVLLGPIVRQWESVPALMEDFLKSLSLTGSRSELEQRLVEIWIPLGEKILTSNLVVSPPWSLHREVNEILGLLIFTDPSGVITWKVTEWKPLWGMTGFINKWVERVGDNPDCFRCLVRLLRGIGFVLVPEFGINWLHRCITRVDDDKDFFKRAGNASSLAELLHDTWSRESKFIQSDRSIFKHFVFLVDKVAEQGEQIAVRLQKHLQGLEK